MKIGCLLVALTMSACDARLAVVRALEPGDGGAPPGDSDDAGDAAPGDRDVGDNDGPGDADLPELPQRSRT